MEDNRRGNRLNSLFITNRLRTPRNDWWNWTNNSLASVLLSHTFKILSLALLTAFYLFILYLWSLSLSKALQQELFRLQRSHETSNKKEIINICFSSGLKLMYIYTSGSCREQLMEGFFYLTEVLETGGMWLSVILLNKAKLSLKKMNMLF